ncbi:iron ABC transporter permease [Planococcus sp. ANT_H30]|uniref:Iron-siderophore ABC transporter permease n=1 Tax=Planococcus kocurii TaxID=1374 RepID=A0ABN4JTW3_9BACL|nr:MULTISPECIES: iron ABC transporter permease [Planococcus]ALS78441.1 iron-siderophore ABC transporter permease [Planococcus kocurii]KAA0958146.1 iron ABC transporter permease [Planococcus sp. ANT_H30]
MRKLSAHKPFKLVVLFASIMVMIFSFVLSLSLGQNSIPFWTTIEALLYFDATNTEHIIVTTSRMTRTIIATFIGANLAVAGALMQAMTRNPLASPDILGVNAGALFFIVLSATFFSVDSLQSYMWIAFLGAGVAGVSVYFLGSLGKDGLSPIRLVLAGAAISALFVSFTQGLLVVDEQRLQSILFWLAGSVSGRSLDMIIPVLPYMLIALIIALFLGKPVTILLAGEDVAKSLGQRTALLKVVIGIVVIVLAGGSVAVAGSIGFIGLIVPHLVKGIVGPDYRWVIILSALMGASLLLLADVVARFIIAPQEMPIGVMTALIGTPFFIYIARKGVVKSG